jgi:hypothetical protein
MAVSEFRGIASQGEYSISGGDVSWTFLRDGDRWIHHLRLDAHGTLAATVEPDPMTADPARVVSPTYQDLQEHRVGRGVCLLLTGQATPHHFSAVVTARRDGPSRVVEFDIADRCRAPMEFLAATYVVRLGSGGLLDADRGRVVWGGDALAGGRLEFTTRGGDTVVLAEAGRGAARVQALAKLDPSIHTQRLFYTWRWTPAGESTA